MSSALSFVAACSRDTQFMSRLERDAYRNLIDAYAFQRGPLPDDDARLAVVARCSRAVWRKMRPLLETYFEVADGLWCHARLEREFDGQQAENEPRREVRPEISAVRRAAAEERWRRARAKADADANLHARPDANDAKLDANASAPLKHPEFVTSGLLRAGSNKPLDARASAKHAKRQERLAREPMLRTFSAIKGAMIERQAQAPPSHFANVWERVTARLERELGAQRYAYWIAPLTVVSAEAGRVVIGCNSRFERDTICTDAGIGERIAALIREARGENNVAVDFTVLEIKPPETAAA